MLTRKAIAQEALKLLENKTINGKRRIYVQFTSWTMFKTIEDLKKIIESEHCEVCALGALFCGAVQLIEDSNRIHHPYSRWISRWVVVEYLGQYFTEEELKLIEKLFEVTFWTVPANDALIRILNAIAKEELNDIHRNWEPENAG